MTYEIKNFPDTPLRHILYGLMKHEVYRRAAGPILYAIIKINTPVQSLKLSPILGRVSIKSESNKELGLISLTRDRAAYSFSPNTIKYCWEDCPVEIYTESRPWGDPWYALNIPDTKIRVQLGLIRMRQFYDLPEYPMDVITLGPNHHGPKFHRPRNPEVELEILTMIAKPITEIPW